MFSDLNVFKLSYAMATHAGQRQAIIAQNVANADTPGYRARDIADFDSAYRTDDAASGMRASRAGHFNASPDTMSWGEITPDGPTDPNENAVSVELEMVKGVEAKRQHDKALAIYKSSLNVLRASLGRS